MRMTKRMVTTVVPTRRTTQKPVGGDASLLPSGSLRRRQWVNRGWVCERADKDWIWWGDGDGPAFKGWWWAISAARDATARADQSQGVMLQSRLYLPGLVSFPIR